MEAVLTNEVVCVGSRNPSMKITERKDDPIYLIHTDISND
jgi:hypothetical protein